MAKVHRMYRHSWWRTSKEITTRDMQAMRNFYEMGIAIETIAQHFGCSEDFAAEMIDTRPWLLSKNNAIELGTNDNFIWWESDHSDPLYLVKLYYPQYLPEQVERETSAKEKHSTGEYLDYSIWMMSRQYDKAEV